MFDFDSAVIQFDQGLRALTGQISGSRPSPAHAVAEGDLSQQQRLHSASLMRINHVGEVCAQALYQSQAYAARSPEIAHQFKLAGLEEQDHLNWTADRLKELGAGASLFNPLWYVASYAVGAIAGRLGDAISLGFMVETERQVEAHLAGHLDQLPIEDLKSRSIVAQMQQDEEMHGNHAQSLGAASLPRPVKYAMHAMSKVMTTVAYYL